MLPCAPRRGPAAGAGATMTLFALSGVLLAVSVGGAAAADAAVVREIAPTGKLRLGVAFAPVPTASAIKTIADADRPDGTIVGVANTTTIRAAARTATNARVVAATSIDDA